MSAANDNPWKTRCSQVRFENPWIRVVQNEIINPSGGAGEYTVVEFKHRAVSIIPIDDEDFTWLVGQYRYATHTYEWEIPAGGAPIGESTLDCAKRELGEEVGLQADEWDLVHDGLQLSNSVTNEVAFTYVARHLKACEARPEETEQLQLRRIPLEEAVEMAINGTIRDCFSVVSLMKLKHLMLRGKLRSV